MPSAVAPNSDENVLYAMVGSQYVAKVLAALDACAVPYRVVEVDILKLKQALQPPHTVPQMWWKGELITDSADILNAIDRDVPNAPFKLYPPAKKAAVEELEQHAGTILNAYIIYFTWWVQEGFEASYEKKMFDRYWPLPSFLSKILISMAFDVGRLRGSMRKRVRGTLGEALIPPGRDPAPDEQPNMRASLVEQLKTLEGKLADDAQQYLCGTDAPTAADFAVYGMLERLVGSTGDAEMGVATPWLWGEAKVPRLQAWHARMVEGFPVRFKNKTGACKVWAK